MPAMMLPARPRTSLRMLELEITNRCGLACSHCFNRSGPSGSHGAMATSDWLRVIDQAAACGVEYVQLIGGEPTLHPDFERLLTHAVGSGMGVEVFSSMVMVRPRWWALYERHQVRLGTSYYSDLAAEHDTITGRMGSHARTRANIGEAVGRGLRIRAGIVRVLPGQRVEQARADLEAIGVAPHRIRIDRMRAVGRGNRAGTAPTVAELCGRCGHNNAAVGPDGQVWGCTIARFLPPAGNVRVDELAAILQGSGMAALLAAILPRLQPCSPQDPCQPDDSAPMLCGPDL